MSEEYRAHPAGCDSTRVYHPCPHPEALIRHRSEKCTPQNAESFPADVSDEGNHFLLEAELPGFSREELCIDIGHEVMIVSGQHIPKADSDRRYLRCERHHGAVSRTFSLTGIRAEAITAKYQNGLLLITLPKKDGYDTPTRRLAVEE